MANWIYISWKVFLQQLKKSNPPGIFLQSVILLGSFFICEKHILGKSIQLFTQAVNRQSEADRFLLFLQNKPHQDV